MRMPVMQGRFVTQSHSPLALLKLASQRLAYHSSFDVANDFACSGCEQQGSDLLIMSALEEEKIV